MLFAGLLAAWADIGKIARATTWPKDRTKEKAAVCRVDFVHAMMNEPS
jgi:hypothetical protein